MPEFNTVSVQEAKLRTRSGGRSKVLDEYARYIQELPHGQAGHLHAVDSENPATIRQRLAHAAKAMEIPLVIKRTGKDIYFWRENEEAAQPRRGRGRRPRKQPTPPEPVISDLETGDGNTPKTPRNWDSAQ